MVKAFGVMGWHLTRFFFFLAGRISVPHIPPTLRDTYHTSHPRTPTSLGKIESHRINMATASLNLEGLDTKLNSSDKAELQTFLSHAQQRSEIQSRMLTSSILLRSIYLYFILYLSIALLTIKFSIASLLAH